MSAQVGREMVRLLFIVARDHLELWHHLKRDFAQDEAVEVILDRRRGGRRQRVQIREPERRRADRRRRSGIDKDLHYRS
jgi:hypothetical protein